MTCPDKECHKNLMLRLKSKISWKALVPVVGMILVILIAGLTAWGKAKDERRDNKEGVLILKTQLTGIEKSLDEIKRKQIAPEELIRSIKEAIKENMQPKP